MSFELYTLGDFTSGFNAKQFHLEILASSITTTLNGISVIGNNIRIYFASTISSAEKTTLDTLVSNHVPNSFTPLKSVGASFPIMTTILPVKAYTTNWVDVLSMSWNQNQFDNFNTAQLIFESQVGQADLFVRLIIGTDILASFNSNISETGVVASNLPTSSGQIKLQISRQNNLDSPLLLGASLFVTN